MPWKESEMATPNRKRITLLHVYALIVTDVFYSEAAFGGNLNLGSFWHILLREYKRQWKRHFFKWWIVFDMGLNTGGIKVNQDTMYTCKSN